MGDVPCTVLGEGPQNAHVVIVGEAPGRDEEEQKRPFVGAAGRMLNALLAAAGLRREECYITNLVKVRPPENSIERLHELGVSIQDYIPPLRTELESINPRVIIALGDHATHALTGKRPITKWRGSVLPCTLVDGLKVVPTLHPAYILRDYAMSPVVILDLIRARKERSTRSHEAFQPTLILQPSLHAILEYIEKCHAEKMCSFDVETLGPRTRCLGLAATEETAICIPFKRGPVNVWSEDDEHTIWQAVRRLFADPTVYKVAQNMQFDLYYVTPHTGFPRGSLFDTMLAHHLLYPELPHDLDFLTSVYTNIGYYGLKCNVVRAQDFDVWVYNCHDVLATLQVRNKIVEELKERKLSRFFYGYTMPLSVCLYEMQQRGVAIDETERTRMIAQLQQEAEDLKVELNTVANRDTAPNVAQRTLNANSPKQLQEYFYGDRGYKQQYNRKRHTVTVDRTALMKMASEGSRAAQLILDIRTREKLVSTFLDVPLAPDRRLHCEYVITGTVTGRLSSRAPLTGFGTNLQNIHKDARKVFVPAPGHVFVKGDLSQAENRVVAWITRGSMKRAFERGDDVHMLTAKMLGVDRSIAKVCNHAANYGMGPGQLAALLSCAMPESKKYLEGYHKAYPEVHEWHERIRRQLAKNRTLSTPLGRSRKFLGRWGDELFRAAYSFVPQSVVADVLNLGLIKLWLTLKEHVPGAAPILQVHDEVVVECKAADAPAVDRLMHECIEYPLIIEGSVLTIPLETKLLTQNWLQ